MDKESSTIILNWDAESDLEEHFEELLFKLKNEVLTVEIHPLVFKKKLTKFQKQIAAFYFLTGGEMLDLTFDETITFTGTTLEVYNSFEKLKSELKVKILSEEKAPSLHVLFQKYLQVHFSWWKHVSQITISEQEITKETEKVNPMDLYSQINDWSSSNYDVSLFEKPNFASLRYEILRAKIFIKKYE